MDISVTTILLVISLCLNVILFCLLMLGGKPGKKSTKGKTGRKRQGGSVNENKAASKSVSPKVPKAASKTVPSSADTGKPEKKPRQTVKKPVSNKDTDIQKYVEYVKNYLKTEYDNNISPVGVKKYYSEIHGMECVDFTYRLAEGIDPKFFRSRMNAIDTALTNISGTNTITFQGEGADENTYKTVFYLK